MRQAPSTIFVIVLSFTCCVHPTHPETPSTVHELSGCYELSFVPAVFWQQTSPPRPPLVFRLLPTPPEEAIHDNQEPMTLCLHTIRSLSPTSRTDHFSDGCWEPQGADGMHMKWEDSHGWWNLTVRKAGSDFRGEAVWTGGVFLNPTPGPGTTYGINLRRAECRSAV
jgi:hypothetical protein